ncbi:resolvase [Amycolatopsis sp. cmx-11-51]|uniref:resolvase n=1 Tax=Amycolatopsis sp. cmx-11-51 TaxID=2785797 RepID=UPI0039E5C128
MELCRRYSNRQDLVNPLVNVLNKIQNGSSDANDDLVTVNGTQSDVWRIADRLSPSDIESLVESYRTGGTLKAVAERYGVSVATVKRLAREHGVRKQRPRSQAS